MSSSSSTDLKLPNLPGHRRYPLEDPPKIFSKSRPRSSQEPRTVSSYEKSILKPYLKAFGDPNKNYPKDVYALNDTTGRYSIKTRQHDRSTRQMTLPFSNMDHVPPFVTAPTGRIYHFFSYYTEINEDNETIIRKATINYFDVNNTLEVEAPVIPNTGKRALKILKRMAVKNPDKNRNFLIDDFIAGEQINIFGRIYTIADCDNHTRDLIEQLGFDFGEAVEIPSTGFEDTEKPQYIRTMTPSNSATSIILRKVHPGDEDKVLSFIGMCNGMDIQLFYKVMDNTITIYFNRLDDVSDRKAPIKSVIKNTKVLKEHLDGSEDDSTLLICTADDLAISPLTKRYFLHWHDLKIGVTLPMQGFNITILDADKATRQFYSSYGFDLEKGIKVNKPKVEIPKHMVPPSTGFGSYDDSIMSCFAPSIARRLQRTRVNKARSMVDLKIQYRAVIIDPRDRSALGQLPESNPRQFTITMFLDDETIMISELPPTRFGCPVGTVKAFLSKRKLQNPDGSLIIVPADLYAGAHITVNGFKFYIYHAMRSTLQYMEERTDQWVYSDINQVQGKLVAQQALLADLIAQLSAAPTSDSTPSSKTRTQASGSNSNSSSTGNGNDKSDKVFSIAALDELFNNSRHCDSNFNLQELITLVRYLNDAPCYGDTCAFTTRPGTASDRCSSSDSVTASQLYNYVISLVE